jgi:uncharacterized protein (DUF2235 family)
MLTRSILCFDGTWNSPAEDPTAAASVETNVVRFYESVIGGGQGLGCSEKDGISCQVYPGI